jgi:hypothetical protein
MEFNGDFFLQIFGMAMGTPMAVVIANIYMAMLEELLKDKLTLLNIDWPHFYKRFIDDMFLIFRGPCTKASEFLTLFIEMVPSIKCEKFGDIGSKVDFLDLTIFKGERFQKEGKLDIRTFQKPQNAYMYIPLSSDHPKDMFKSFVQGELRRYIRNNSSKAGFTHMAKVFIARLLDRGYDPAILKEWFSEIKYENRKKYLAKQIKPKEGVKVLPFKVTYDRFIGKLKLGKKLQNCVSRHRKQLSFIFDQYRPLVCFKKGKTIGQTVVRAQIKSIKNAS